MALTAPKIGQLRFYGIGNSKNFPIEDTEKHINPWGGVEDKRTNLLSDYGNAIKIGIQSLPGTKFYLNSLEDGIILDHTGVYELDLTNTSTTISYLSFDPDSLKRISDINNAVLIIDILYYEAVNVE